MKNFNFLILFVVSLLILFSASTLKAQDEMPSNSPPKRQSLNHVQRPNLLEELGLTQNQRQQIRRITTEKRPLVRAAQMRLREANINLDKAIYADNVNDDDVQARLKDVQAAHAEVLKIRFSNELAIRKILTVEQLAKFRSLRQQFAENMQNNPEPSTDRPLQNIRQGLKLRQNPMRPKN